MMATGSAKNHKTDRGIVKKENIMSCHLAIHSKEVQEKERDVLSPGHSQQGRARMSCHLAIHSKEAQEKHYWQK